MESDVSVFKNIGCIELLNERGSGDDLYLSSGGEVIFSYLVKFSINVL